MTSYETGMLAVSFAGLLLDFAFHVIALVRDISSKK